MIQLMLHAGFDAGGVAGGGADDVFDTGAEVSAAKTLCLLM